MIMYVSFIFAIASIQVFYIYWEFSMEPPLLFTTSLCNAFIALFALLKLIFG